MKRIIFPLFAVMTLLSSNAALSNERRFTYVYETSVLPPGAREIEIWNTDRRGRSYFYRRLDQRIEYEFGVTNNVMSAFILNYTSKAYDSNGGAHNGTKTSSYSMSISNEWKYKLFDRVADPIGLGLYVEGTIAPDEAEIEGKILLDKEIGHFLFATNLVGEQEWENDVDNGKTMTESEFKTEINLGIAYFLSHNFSLGVEAVQQNVAVGGVIEHSSFFAGPVISYSSQTWWVTLTSLPQIKSFKGGTTLNKQLDLDEFEKIQTRLLFSFQL